MAAGLATTPISARPSCAAWLKEEGFDVRMETSTAAFADPAIHDLSLIVPIFTMSKIEKDEAANLCAAVRGGVGLARQSRRHGRRVPRCRGIPVHVRRAVGRPSRQHHRLLGRRDEARRSDHGRHQGLRIPLRAVLHARRPGATKCWRRPPSPASTRPGPRASSCPSPGRSTTAEGGCSICSLGHRAYELDVPEMKTILRRGMVWAAR